MIESDKRVRRAIFNGYVEKGCLGPMLLLVSLVGCFFLLLRLLYFKIGITNTNAMNAHWKWICNYTTQHTSISRCNICVCILIIPSVSQTDSLFFLKIMHIFRWTCLHRGHFFCFEWKELTWIFIINFICKFFFHSHPVYEMIQILSDF